MKYTKSNKYDQKFLKNYIMGPNPMKLLPTLSKKPQKSHQKGMELPDPCRYFLRKLCGVLVAYFILS